MSAPPLTEVDYLTPADVKAFRRTKGWSQKRLSEALDVHMQTVVHWEGGRNPIPPMVRLAFAAMAAALPLWVAA